jgi:hypothetical protein
MLEIAKSNSKTSNNNIRLVAAALAISVARLVAAALAIPIAATLLKPITLVVFVIAAPLKCNACKAAGGRAASSAS